MSPPPTKSWIRPWYQVSLFNVGFDITVIYTQVNKNAGEVEMDDYDFDSQYADELDALQDFERMYIHNIYV